MKKGILLLFVITAVTANAQTLKDALYGGKLKTDSGTVIKKGDDLSTKIDTSRKKPVEPEKTKLTLVVADSAAKKITAANQFLISLCKSSLSPTFPNILTAPTKSAITAIE